jgi:hypothetical protein
MQFPFMQLLLAKSQVSWLSSQNPKYRIEKTWYFKIPTVKRNIFHGTCEQSEMLSNVAP